MRSYAQKMIDEHTRASEQLKSLADQQGIMVPTEPTAEQKAGFEKLSKLSGPAFDKAYMTRLSAKAAMARMAKARAQ